MKKTLLTIGLFTSLALSAQTTVTFEDLTLTPNSHYDGSDGNGGFTSGGTYFTNTYSGYWANGFIYSNSTDVTTPGYTNGFSAITGVGANNSANYGVNYGGDLNFTTPRLISSIAITNSTYAALSMRDGDTYGKQFGSVNDAQGNPDGTNGEDYFRLIFRGLDATGNYVPDSVVFYLADFRFSDNSQDYILYTWSTVDLTVLGEISGLTFELQSTDVGQFGMNTPAYFALDNIVYSSLGLPTNLSDAIKIYPNPSSTELTISGVKGEISIVSLDGKTVFQGNTSEFNTISVIEFPVGMYVVSCETSEGIARTTFVKN